MFNTPRRAAVAVLLCCLVFSLGLGWLFWLRFQAGDLYPPYSSLRGDPLGTQVFYESIQAVDEGGVRRNFRPPDQVAINATTTFLVCGVGDGGPFFTDRAWTQLLERLANQGGRLVITFRPTRHRAQIKRDTSDEARDDQGQEPPEGNQDRIAPDDGAAPTPAEEPGTEEHNENSTSSEKEKSMASADEGFDLLERLGLAVEKMHDEAYDDFALISSDWTEPLPEMIPWRARVAFDLQAPEWAVVYWWQDAPVVVQRTWGGGTVVLVGDSYLFSNEALRADRVTELLAWSVHLPNQLIVDEFHHGLVKQPGIADLVRKYRLQGAAASLLIVVVLLLWRQAAPFAPASTETRVEAEESAVGRGAQEGWVGLIQQHIRSDDLMGVCHEAWRTSPAINRVADERVARVAALMRTAAEAPRRPQPVTLYRQICQLLKEGKHP